jgi:hypothetical protein
MTKTISKTFYSFFIFSVALFLCGNFFQIHFQFDSGIFVSFSFFSRDFTQSSLNSSRPFSNKSLLATKVIFFSLLYFARMNEWNVSFFSLLLKPVLLHIFLSLRTAHEAVEKILLKILLMINLSREIFTSLRVVEKARNKKSE